MLQAGGMRKWICLSHDDEVYEDPEDCQNWHKDFDCGWFVRSLADDPAAVERVLDHLVKGAPQDVKDAIWKTQEFRDYCRPYAQEMLRAAETGDD